MNMCVGGCVCSGFKYLQGATEQEKTRREKCFFSVSPPLFTHMETKCVFSPHLDATMR